MPTLPSRQLIVPLTVACALFMENLDSTVISTALPAIATSLHEEPLRLNLAITSYLLSLAIFIPASGWMADRFGGRTVFRAAIFVFIGGSICCGLSNSLPEFVAARIFQGIGGAMMVPVGRFVMLRTVEKSQLVRSMSYLTTPALLGPVIGPPLGGFIVTYASWRWIFFINIPIGILGIVLVSVFVENYREPDPRRLDVTGFIMTGIGLAGVMYGFENIGRGVLPGGLVAGLLIVGIVSLCLYVWHARLTPAPIVDLSLLRIPTFFSAVLGGSLFRIDDAAIGLRPVAFRVGSPDFRQRRRRHDDEDDGDADHSLVGLPDCVARQRLRQQPFPDGLRLVSAEHAACGDSGDPVDRRLFPLAAIHQHQYAQLCRRAARTIEPRVEFRQHGATALDQYWGGHGRASRAFHPVLAWRGSQGRGFLSGLSRRRSHFHVVCVFFLPSGAGRRRRGQRSSCCSGRGRGSRAGRSGGLKMKTVWSVHRALRGADLQYAQGLW
jgi:MFS family permease